MDNRQPQIRFESAEGQTWAVGSWSMTVGWTYTIWYKGQDPSKSNIYEFRGPAFVTGQGVVTRILIRVAPPPGQRTISRPWEVNVSDIISVGLQRRGT